MKDPIQHSLEQKRLRLRQIEAQYLRTRDFLKSPEWNVKRDTVLMKLAQVLASYKLGGDATAAVFIVGQARQILVEVQEVTDVVIEYEALSKELERYASEQAAGLR